MQKTDMVLPLIPLRGLTVLPLTTINFMVGRKKSIIAIEDAVKNHSGYILLVSQKDPEITEPKREDIETFGVIARVLQVANQNNENLRVIVQGTKRIKFEELLKTSPFYKGKYSNVRELHSRTTEAKAYMRKCMELVEEHYLVGERINKDMFELLSDETDTVGFLNKTAHMFNIKDKQYMLDEQDIILRYQRLYKILQDDLEIAKIEKRISKKVRNSIDKSQKEYFLREQMRAIQEELGDKEDDDVLSKIEDLKASEETKKKLRKDVKRNAKTPINSPDYAIQRNYLDFVFELPWGIETKDNNDLKHAKKILDEDHFGLDKIKERILEFLAVRQLTDKRKEPILCFVGPPGVGKTSIVRSIARAMDRKYIRMSLGGVHDEAEIRGHRKTYVGAMPGRIISNIKLAGSMNPVFLLDEIDKLSNDYRGDPASALLEVLDPEQNNTFRDNYLEIPFDLSKVIFITTANNPDTIPSALYDRMEIIEMNGYTPEEKLQIAKRHLISKQMNAHGLSDENIGFTDEAINKIIYNYTRESGVRNLEKEIANVMRKVAMKIVVGNYKGKFEVNEETVGDLLGIEKFSSAKKQEKDEVGAATGLAWTTVGGEILTIEVTLISGKGNILLTGHLGDVMKESARTAISFIHSHAKEFGIKDDVFSKNDIHIHVPEGAIPKDGPSAGITIATAVLSALTNKGIKSDVAMTGEITLRGKVLPIGGLKEKTLAAHRAGIKTILIPNENKKDLMEIPKSVRDDLNFVLVDNVMSVFKNAIQGL